MNSSLKKEVIDIKNDVSFIRKKFMDKEPEHFSKKDVVNAFFGALIIGVTFTMKGAVINTAKNLSFLHVGAIILSTLVILIAETYFAGYSKVKDKSKRKLWQFIFKRITTMYLIAVVVALYLVYVFGINYQEPIANSPIEIFKMVVLISMPCAVGAAIPAMLKRKD